MAHMEPPVKKSEKIDLRINGINHSGEGVGRYGEFAVFVPGTVPGETVTAEVVELKKNYARGRLLEIKERSQRRTNPECAYFSACGGCHLQYIDYEELLRLKTVLVRDSLARIASLEGVTVHNAIGMEFPWRYRNKARFQVKESGGKLSLGFFEEGSRNLAACFRDGLKSGCLLVDMELNEIASTVETLLNKHTGSFAGSFRHVVLRKAFGTGELMAVVVTGSEEWPGEKRFAGELLSLHPGLTSIVRNINDGPPGVVMGRENRALAGRDYITDRLGHLVFRISPSSFYQVNPVQALVLYQKTLAYAALTGEETVVDAYSGVGTIALFLAGHAEKVYGLEAVPDAVKDARSNAALNRIGGVQFLEGQVERLLPALSAKGVYPDVVVLDPPRRGCGRETLDTAAALRVPRIVYVSCNPGTMARDLGILKGGGYRVVEAQPVDMFPWTYHVESIVQIKRAENRMG